MNCPSLDITVTPNYKAAFKRGKAIIRCFPSCKKLRKVGQKVGNGLVQVKLRKHDVVSLTCRFDPTESLSLFYKYVVISTSGSCPMWTSPRSPTSSPPLTDSLRGVPRLAFSHDGGGGVKMPEKGGPRKAAGILQAHLLVVKNGLLFNSLKISHNSIFIHI